MKMMRKIASGASNWKEGECSGYGFSEQAFALTGFSIGGLPPHPKGLP